MKINVFFKNIHTKSLVKKKFKQLFNKNINKSSGIILVEFNKWTSTHISIAYASSVLSKKYNSEIHAYAENGFTKASEYTWIKYQNELNKIIKTTKI